MAEFYVTYEHDGQRYLAAVIASANPGRWKFTNLDELRSAMDALGSDWELLCEIEVPQHVAVDDEFNTWQRRLAEIRNRRQLPRPDVSLAGQGVMQG